MIRERDTLVQELAVLMSSGMSLIVSLSTIHTETKSVRWKARLSVIVEDIENGQPFWRAAERAKLLSSALVPLLRIGEESGQLAHHLTLIAQAQEKDRALHGKIQSALLYPSFILIVMMLVASGTTALILPRLATLFHQLNIPLPFLTSALINTGIFLREQGLILAAGIVCVGVVGVCIMRAHPAVSETLRELSFFFPATRSFFQSIELTRFGFLLGTLLSVGVPILDALQALADATPFRRYKRAYLFFKDSIEEGHSFEKSFRAFGDIGGVMPLSVRQMVAAGEQSGNLSEALFAVGRRYEEQGEKLSKNIPALLEPTLLVIVWLGVVAVALAVILPLYRLVGSLR